MNLLCKQTDGAVQVSDFTPITRRSALLLGNAMKRCPKCGKIKLETDFCKNRSNKDGLSGWCKTCNSATLLSWRLTHSGYRRWTNMKRRCSDPKSNSYYYYGGRGIAVCDRWQDSYENFLADMGECPSAQHTLDRIDNNGNYEPGNCRWVTRKQQSHNRRSNLIIEHAGKRLCVAEWADILGIKVDRLYKRLYLGWPIERVLRREKMTKWSIVNHNKPKGA